ncbi:MAG: EamA family transporter [Ilumatobacter sp.]
MSILFALAAAVGFGSSDFAAGHASRRSSAVSVVILTHFASFIALLAVSAFPGQRGSPTVLDIGWGLAAGLGGGFGAMFLFRGLGKGSMAVVAPITAAGAATIPVMAGLLQGESISIFGVFGVLLALVAIVMISLCADEADDDALDDALDVAPGEFARTDSGAQEARSTPLASIAAAFIGSSVAWTTPPSVSALTAPTWGAPVGQPLNHLVLAAPATSPAHVAPSSERFAPVFAPPVVGPACVMAASTPLASSPPTLRTFPAPTGPARAPAEASSTAAPFAAPRSAASMMPPPLMRRSPVDAVPNASVALLDVTPVPDDISSLLDSPRSVDAPPTLSAAPATARRAPAPPPPPVPPVPPPPALVASAHAPSDATPRPPTPLPPTPRPSMPTAPPAPIEPVLEATSSPGVVVAVRSVLGRPGIIDALLSGVGFGLFFVFIARTAETAGQWPLASARGISAAMFFVGALVARGAVLPEKGSRKAVVLAGALDAMAAVFFVLAARAGLLSVGAVLASLYPAATIVLARFISQERISRRQIYGLVLAGLAVSLLAI